MFRQFQILLAKGAIIIIFTLHLQKILQFLLQICLCKIKFFLTNIKSV
jgi:hypothetical protein